MTAWLIQSTMVSASVEKKQALVDKMIDDHICQLHAKKQQQALKAAKAMATIFNHHDVPMEIMTLPAAMDILDVDEDTH